MIARLRTLGTIVLLGVVALGMTPTERQDSSPLVEVVGPGASPQAVAAVRALLTEMRVDERLEERLRRARLSIVVVPRRTPMTDVPEFASLRGRRTFDGRLWDEVRGTGGVTLADGRVAVAIPEESILGGRGLVNQAYPALVVAVHELAHALHDRVLTDGDRRAVERAYQARLLAGGPFTDAYARSNPREYFAQGANAFFGRYAGHERRDAAWLYRHDRALYAALAHVFGAPPALPLRTNV